MTYIILIGLVLLVGDAWIIADLVRMHRKQRQNMKRWQEQLDWLMALEVKDEEF